jgi:coatomer subunit beta
MPIIQYVLPNRNKQIKKMLAFYWECVLFPSLGLGGQSSLLTAGRSPPPPPLRICPKLDDNGKLKQEMILVWCVSR